MSLLRPRLLVVLVALSPFALRAQVTIGSFGSSVVSNPLNYDTFGESFTAPTGATELQDMSFELDSSATTSVTAYLFAWNGSNFGAALGSAADSISSPSLTPTDFVFDASVTAGDQYAVMLGVNADANFGYMDSTSYGPGNGLIYDMSNYGGPVAPGDTSGNTYVGGLTLSSEATFLTGAVTPVPEARDFVLGGLVLLAGLGLVHWKRNQPEQAPSLA